MSDSAPDVGDIAIMNFTKAYAEAAGGDATLIFPAVKAGLSAVIRPLSKSQSMLGQELSAWIGLLQVSGYEEANADGQARERFNAALTTALKATFQVGRAEMLLDAALSAPAAPATPAAA